MLTSYTLREMKELWRRRLGLLTDDCGCVVTRHDGTSLDALIADSIRSWYAGLLVREDPSLLPSRDLSSEIIAISRPSYNCIQLTLPDRGVRLLSVQLTDWPAPLGRFVAPDSPEALRQSSPRLAATPRRPVAVLAGRTLRLYGLDRSDTSETPATPEGLLHSHIRSLLMVASPEESDTFTLHQSLLSTIPTNI